MVVGTDVLLIFTRVPLFEMKILNIMFYYNLTAVIFLFCELWTTINWLTQVVQLSKERDHSDSYIYTFIFKINTYQLV